jgi:uncharacterized protein
MKFGLKQETIDKINLVFKNHPEVENAIIYGSRAKGNFRIGSDIDLTLHGGHLTFEILSKINTEIDDLNTPYLFDISIYHQLESADLKQHINRVGIVFYQKN